MVLPFAVFGRTLIYGLIDGSVFHFITRTFSADKKPPTPKKKDQEIHATQAHGDLFGGLLKAMIAYCFFFVVPQLRTLQLKFTDFLRTIFYARQYNDLSVQAITVIDFSLIGLKRSRFI